MSPISWAALNSDPKALGALRTLAANRHIVADISSDQAGVLLRVLENLWQEQSISAAQRVTAFSQTYQLLARWARGQLTTAWVSVDKSQLQEAFAGALQLLHSHWCTAQVSAACILFLGAASKGVAVHSREEAALAACSVLHNHSNDQELSSHMTELTAGIANIMIALECQGSLVLWLLASVLSLWSLRHQSSQAQLSGPEQQQAGQGATSPTSSSMNSDSDLVGQAMSLYSMMRQVGTAMLQRRADCLDAAMQMIELISAASHTGHWQEGMAGVLAAGGLLEGLARGTAAQPQSSPALQALCQTLTHSCTASQAACTQAEQAAASCSPEQHHDESQSEVAGCAMWRDAVAIACCHTWQACRLPPSSGAVAVCLMSCLWKSCLTLRGLFQASALGMDPGQGNAWLEKQSSSRLMQEAATMARVAAELYRLVDEPSRQICRDLLQAGARGVYEGYRGYASTTPLSWMQVVDAGAVRQVLDKAFMSGVLLMTAFWSVAAAADQQAHPIPPSKKSKPSRLKSSTSSGSAATSTSPAATAAGPAAIAPSSAATATSTTTAAADLSTASASSSESAGSLNGNGGSKVNEGDSSRSSLIAVELLDSMSYLQFCRMKLTAYNTLLKNVITAVSTSAQATERLVNKLPRYQDLTALPGDDASRVGASGMGKQQPAWASDTILATRVQLLMSVLGACLPALPQGEASSRIAPLMFLYLQHPQKPLAAAAHSLFCAVLKHTDQKEELVPFYIRRALEAYPACTSITGLSAGVDAAMRELPSGSPAVLLTLHSLAKHASDVLTDNIRLQQSPQAGLDLIKLLAQMLLLVEFQFLPDALSTTGSVVLGCQSRDVQLSACNSIHEVLMTSDDYTRKVKCAQWYQHLAAACARPSMPVSLTGAEELGDLLLTDSPLP